MTKDEHWARQNERGAYWGLVLMFWLYRLGGQLLFGLVLYPVMVYFFVFGATARRASRLFLRRVYASGQSEFKIEPGYWHSFRHMLTFGYAILDKLAIWMGSIDNSRIHFPNREFLRARIREGRGGVILASHLGNLEICCALSQQTPDLKLNVLVHTRHAQNFNAFLQRTQPAAAINFLQVTDVGPDTAMLLKQKVDAGEFLAIVGDRIPVEFPHRVGVVPFLGAPARFPQGPFILASLLKCPVYTLFCMQQGKDYRVDVEPFDEQVVLNRKSREQDLQNYLESYVARLEACALRYPYQWYNFYNFWSEA